MPITRRGFTGGAIGLALSSQLPSRTFAQARPDLSATLAAIRAYGEAHLRYHGLPGMTLGLTTPDGFATVIDLGYANLDARTPIRPDTLFQIGSISKVMTAALLHQFAAEGRLKLTDRVSDLLPSMPLPAGNAIQVQHLLDHVAGLPGDAPLWTSGGLWTAYAPGAHWHYCNTGYEILGKLAEHLGGKPLSELLADRLFKPLGMTRSRGAILGSDRTLYAQGYEAADPTAPFARGVPLKPAAWVDVTFGAGSVASTADDMNRFLRTLADAVQGRGGLGLSAEQAKRFTAQAVPSDTAGMTYGNGLMHVGNAGRSYLHHTGGMVAFSSSFHLDVASGVGAFASTNLSGFAEYRPRQVTLFAAGALTNALARQPLPAPPLLGVPLPGASHYAGRYAGPAGSFEIRPGNPLTIVAGGQSAELQPWGGDLFRTTHPLFHRFTLKLERTPRALVGASWGPNSYAKQGAAWRLPASNAEIARLAGRYVNDSPWVGTAMIVERGGKLWLGTETPLTRIADNLWRIGEEAWSPERGTFDNFIDGRPHTFSFSGEKFHRHDI
jgi:CubicO group peptidase (beta-lactamase class C family)